MACSTIEAGSEIRNSARLCHVSVVTKYVAPGCVRCFGRAIRLQGLKPRSDCHFAAGLKPRPSVLLLETIQPSLFRAGEGSLIREMKSSNKYRASCGPGEASG